MDQPWRLLKNLSQSISGSTCLCLESAPPRASYNCCRAKSTAQEDSLGAATSASRLHQEGRRPDHAAAIWQKLGIERGLAQVLGLYRSRRQDGRCSTSW